MSSTLDAMHGALVVMSTLAALFFVRYWHLSRDRFFLWFAAAFAMFSINWALVLFDVAASEHASPIFACRLLGFVLILAAILVKNRK